MRAAFLSSFPFAPWHEALRVHMPELDLRCWPDIGDPASVEVALVWKPPKGALAQLTGLKLVHALGAGIDAVVADPELPPGVKVVRLVDPWMTAAMGEYVEFQVLRLHRQDFAYRAQQQARKWRELDQPNAAQRRVGILGLGVLGSEAALRLEVLGFDVAGWSRRGLRFKGIACFSGADGLAQLAARSEILICMLPLTKETENILDARLFALLPKGAAVINCARGGHLVEADLLAALDSGHLSAAVLDVFRQEPLPQDHPFWQHPRIVVTPHAAAATNPTTAAPIVAAALKLFAAGQSIANLVERNQGY